MGEVIEWGCYKAGGDFTGRENGNRPATPQQQQGQPQGFIRRNAIRAWCRFCKKNLKKAHSNRFGPPSYEGLGNPLCAKGPGITSTLPGGHGDGDWGANHVGQEGRGGGR